jgi:enoyl-CoA hydratase/carnithine racemase
MQVVDVSIASITATVCPRPAGDVSDLIEALRAVGLLHPVYVRAFRAVDAPLPPFTLLAGSRRLQAARALRWKVIPAVVVSKGGPHADLLRVYENMARRPLPVLVEAHERDVLQVGATTLLTPLLEEEAEPVPELLSREERDLLVRAVTKGVNSRLMKERVALIVEKLKVEP